jgi:hypothetical protein
VKREFKKFQKDLGKKIRKLKSENPKEYWNIVNESKTPNKNLPTCEAFLKFLKSLNESHESTSEIPTVNVHENEELNVPFTCDEVKTCLRKLKNNKSCGQDLIMNEFLKYSSDKMATLITKLFNLILNSGKVPSAWTIGVIKPIFKGKGSVDNPSNYRGITILSCFGKLFTSVLNLRLTSYVDKHNLLGSEQAGFRAGHSPLDHLFTLHSIIHLVLSKEKHRLYCAFLDYEKAFDKVDRSLLWHKLLEHNINGKVLEVIKNMYANAKSCIMVNEVASDFFVTNTGVRQGENLSPLLFALFLNDLKESLNDQMNNLDTIVEKSQLVGLDDNFIFCKLFLLLYADDTIIYSETAEGLQQGLNNIKQYCDKWKLKLNAGKCKVVVFSNGKIRNKPTLFIGKEKLDVVFDFPYLGIKLNYNNRFREAQKDLAQRASRAMFSLLRRCHRLCLPLDVVIELFDKTILPILTYACEVWGYNICDFAKKLQLKFYKIVFKTRQSTPSYFLYGELGKFPVDIHIKCRMLNFWIKLTSPENQSKLSSVMYRFLLRLYNADVHKSQYLTDIKNTLENMGMANIWQQQGTAQISTSWFKEKVKRNLQDLFIQEWYSSIDNGSIYMNYKMFKNTFKYEPYIHVLPADLAIKLFRFRTTNNKLPVNVLRFVNIPRNERLCTKCNMNDVGDEFHYVFCCPFFNDTRIKCLPRFLRQRPNALKFLQLMAHTSKKRLLKLVHFINIINKNLSLPDT